MLLEERAKSGTLTPTPLPLCGRGTQAGYFFFAALRGAFLAGAFFAALRGVAFLAALRGAAFFVAFFTDAFFAVLRSSEERRFGKECVCTCSSRCSPSR